MGARGAVIVDADTISLGRSKTAVSSCYRASLFDSRLSGARARQSYLSRSRLVECAPVSTRRWRLEGKWDHAGLTGVSADSRTGATTGLHGKGRSGWKCVPERLLRLASTKLCPDVLACLRTEPYRVSCAALGTTRLAETHVANAQRRECEL